MKQSDFARLGAQAVNRMYTPAKRKAAAVKGWATRRKNEKETKAPRRARKS